MLLKKSLLCVCDGQEHGELRRPRLGPVPACAAGGRLDGAGGGQAPGTPVLPALGFGPPCGVRSCPLAGEAGQPQTWGTSSLQAGTGSRRGASGNTRRRKNIAKAKKLGTVAGSGGAGITRLGSPEKSCRALSPTLSPGAAPAAQGTPRRPEGGQGEGPQAGLPALQFPYGFPIHLCEIQQKPIPGTAGHRRPGRLCSAAV